MTATLGAKKAKGGTHGGCFRGMYVQWSTSKQCNYKQYACFVFTEASKP
jgi:hypothetical protein